MFVGALLVSATLSATTVRQISLTPLQRVTAAFVLKTLGLKPGQTFRTDEDLETALQKAVQNLLETDQFEDVNLFVQNGTLHVELKEKFSLQSVSCVGTKKNSRLAKVLDQTGMVRGRLVSDMDVQKAVQTLESYFQTLGFFSAKVSFVKTVSSSMRTNVVFQVTEGQKAKVQGVRFWGAHSFPHAELQRAVTVRPTRWYSMVQTSNVFAPDVTAYDAEKLRQFYISKGFLFVRVHPAIVEISPDHQNFYITFGVEEGPRYRIGSVRVTHAPDLEPLPIPNVSHELAFLTRTPSSKKHSEHRGLWFNRARIQAVSQAIKRCFSEAGFRFFDVDFDLKPNQTTHTIDVVFQVQKTTPAVSKGEKVSGNQRTDERLVYKHFQALDGQPISEATVAAYEDSAGMRELPCVQTARMGLSTKKPEGFRFSVLEGDTFGAGAKLSWKQSGMGLEFFINEKNFTGNGSVLKLAYGLTQHGHDANVSISQPFVSLFGMDVELGAAVGFSDQSVQRKRSGDFVLSEKDGKKTVHSWRDFKESELNEEQKKQKEEYDKAFAKLKPAEQKTLTDYEEDLKKRMEINSELNKWAVSGKPGMDWLGSNKEKKDTDVSSSDKLLTYRSQSKMFKIFAQYPLIDRQTVNLSETLFVQVEHQKTAGYLRNVSPYLQMHFGKSTAWTFGMENALRLSNRGLPRPFYSPFVKLGTEATFGSQAGFGKCTVEMGHTFPLNFDGAWKLDFRYNAGVFMNGSKSIAGDRLFKLGWDSFIGFDPEGVSPLCMNTKDALGGKKFYSAAVFLTFPFRLFPPTWKMSPFLVGQSGAVWDAGHKEIPLFPIAANTFKNRFSAGGGFSWQSPMGMLTVALAKPIAKDSADNAGVFYITMGKPF